MQRRTKYKQESSYQNQAQNYDIYNDLDDDGCIKDDDPDDIIKDEDDYSNDPLFQ